MRKLFATIILALLVPCILLSSSVEGLFSTSSDIWKASSALCIANGVLPPPATSPVAGSDILASLGEIPEESLDVDEKTIRDHIVSEITGGMIYESEFVSLDPRIAVSPEIYAQSKVLEKQWDHIYDVKDMMPFLDFGFDMKFSNYAYAFGDWTMLSPGLESLYDEKFKTNLDQKIEFQHEGMMNGGVLLGTDIINFGIYRTRQEFGYGKTGNLVIGDNFSRQDYMRLNIRSPWFNYTGNITHFDTERLMDDASSMPHFVDGKGYAKTHFNGMHVNQSVHRFDFKIASKVNLTVQEGLMLYTDSAFDPRLLNPFHFLHGYFNNGGNIYIDVPATNGDESNNYMSFEMEWAIIPHLSMNVQFLMDQLQLSGDGSGAYAVPHAYAALWNFESPWIVEDHYINAWYEGAFVMPYTYLNYKKTGEQFNPNLDMITGYHNHLQEEFGYAGYSYGSDSIVNAIGVSFGIPGTYDVDFAMTYLIHGQYGYGYKSVIAERGPEHFTDMMLAGIGLDGAEHRVIIQLDGSYTPFEWMTLKAGMGLVSITNLGCEKGNNLTDMIFKLGLSFDLAAL